jgi:hypothetical protein
MCRILMVTDSLPIQGRGDIQIAWLRLDAIELGCYRADQDVAHT